jgi:hypothetical protein
MVLIITFSLFWLKVIQLMTLSLRSQMDMATSTISISDRAWAFRLFPRTPRIAEFHEVSGDAQIVLSHVTALGIQNCDAAILFGLGQDNVGRCVPVIGRSGLTKVERHGGMKLLAWW